jgi:hypothetical protein
MGRIDPPTRIRQAFEVSPVEERNRRKLYDSMRARRPTTGPDMQTFIGGLYTQMTGTFGVPV